MGFDLGYPSQPYPDLWHHLDEDRPKIGNCIEVIDSQSTTEL